MSTAAGTPEQYAVSLGAAMLDEHDNGWWREDVERAIDLDTLQMQDGRTCVLGQRCPLEVLEDYRRGHHTQAPPYFAYAALLGGGDWPGRDRWAIVHGFVADSGRWNELTGAWHDLITRRRKGAAEAGELAQ
jgi:hypothetical protein